jgi:hypothetical protein
MTGDQQFAMLQEVLKDNWTSVRESLNRGPEELARDLFSRLDRGLISKAYWRGEVEFEKHRFATHEVLRQLQVVGVL